MKILEIAIRLLYVILFSFAFIYICFPPLWILEIPYWIITGNKKSLFEKLFNFYFYKL